MSTSRILGIVLLICSSIAYSVSKQHHKTANLYESDVQTGTADQRELFVKLAARHQAASMKWGVASMIGFIGAAVLIAGPAYLRRRRERDPAVAAANSNAAEGEQPPRLTGLARRGALLALAGAITGLICIDLPGRRFLNEFDESINVPVREFSIQATLILLTGFAAAILAAILILGRSPNWRRPVAYTLIAVAALLTLNAIYAFVHIPSYDVDDANFSLAYGTWLNALTAIATVAGAVVCLRSISKATPAAT
jgi:hypothetical protein